MADISDDVIDPQLRLGIQSNLQANRRSSHDAPKPSYDNTSTASQRLDHGTQSNLQANEHSSCEAPARTVENTSQSAESSSTALSTVADSTVSSPTAATNLLSIPKELRHMILAYLLSIEKVFYRQYTSLPSIEDESGTYAEDVRLLDDTGDLLATSMFQDPGDYQGNTNLRSYCPFSCDILRTCRTLYADGQNVLYGQNKFVAVATPRGFPLSEMAKAFGAVLWRLPSNTTALLGQPDTISQQSLFNPVVAFYASGSQQLVDMSLQDEDFIVPLQDVVRLSKCLFLSDDLPMVSSTILRPEIEINVSSRKLSILEYIHESMSPWLVLNTSRTVIAQEIRTRMGFDDFTKYAVEKFALAQDYDGRYWFSPNEKAEECYSGLLEDGRAFLMRWASIPELTPELRLKVNRLVVRLGVCMYHLLRLCYYRALESGPAERRGLLRNVEQLARLAMQLPSTESKIRWKIRLLLWIAASKARQFLDDSGQPQNDEPGQLPNDEDLRLSTHILPQRDPADEGDPVDEDDRIIFDQWLSNIEVCIRREDWLQDFVDSWGSIEGVFPMWLELPDSHKSRALVFFLSLHIAVSLRLYYRTNPAGVPGATLLVPDSKAGEEYPFGFVSRLTWVSRDYAVCVDIKAKMVLEACNEEWGVVQLADANHGPLVDW